MQDTEGFNKPLDILNRINSLATSVLTVCLNSKLLLDKETSGFNLVEECVCWGGGGVGGYSFPVYSSGGKIDGFEKCGVVHSSKELLFSCHLDKYL